VEAKRLMRDQHSIRWDGNTSETKSDSRAFKPRSFADYTLQAEVDTTRLRELLFAIALVN